MPMCMMQTSEAKHQNNDDNADFRSKTLGSIKFCTAHGTAMVIHVPIGGEGRGFDAGDLVRFGARRLL